MSDDKICRQPRDYCKANYCDLHGCQDRHEDPATEVNRAIANARRERLWECLETLSSWAASRAGKEYNTDTTLTMLARKVQDIMHSVDKAGWRASKQYEHNQGEQP